MAELKDTVRTLLWKVREDLKERWKVKDDLNDKSFNQVDVIDSYTDKFLAAFRKAGYVLKSDDQTLAETYEEYCERSGIKILTIDIKHDLSIKKARDSQLLTPVPIGNNRQTRWVKIIEDSPKKTVEVKDA